MNSPIIKLVSIYVVLPQFQDLLPLLGEDFTTKLQTSKFLVGKCCALGLYVHTWYLVLFSEISPGDSLCQEL